MRRRDEMTLGDALATLDALGWFDVDVCVVVMRFSESQFLEFQDSFCRAVAADPDVTPEGFVVSACRGDQVGGRGEGLGDESKDVVRSGC